MEVAGERGGGHRDPLGLEVVTRGEVDIPAIADTDITAEVKSLSNLIGIAHLVVVELADIGILAHADIIADAQVPGYLEGHVAVFVSLGLVAAALTAAASLGLLHVLIDVRVDAIVEFIIIFLLLVLLFVIDILTAQTLDPVADLLVAQTIGEVLRQTREASELTLLPVGGVIADHWAPQTVELVDIRGEGGVEVQGIALRELQAQGGLQVAQGALICHEVIAHAELQLINQTDLLETSRVLIRLDLHLDIVGEVEVDAA